MQLECIDLSFGHEGKAIINNLDFSICAGDYLCIIGENGAGKSTLMKTILGLIPLIGGSIHLISKKEVSYLPQQTAMQKDFPASVEEIVCSGLIPKMGMRPFYNKKEKQQVKETLEQLGLSTLRKKCYRELSGGQQERVLLARAIVSNPKILFLDEPVAGLDPVITAQLYEILGQLNKQNNTTIVMISHDLQASFEHANKVLFLGKQSFFGMKEEYLEKYHPKGVDE